MATLYDIDQRILETIDPETGEIIDDAKLDALIMERTDKVESVVLWIKNLSADAAAYKAEKEAFADRERKALAKIDQLKRWLAFALEGQKFNTWRCSVTFRKSETVDVYDETKVPQDWLTCKTTVAPNKAAIKDALKAGQEVSGCRLVEKINPQIK